MSKYAAFVGIDWASEKHDFSVKFKGVPSEGGEIRHTAETIREWVNAIHRRAGGQVAVCLEQSRGSLFNALSEYPFLTLFPVNPVTLARYRQAFVPSGAKDDPTDASLERELLERHLDKLKCAVVQDPVTQELELCVQGRRATVDERTRLVNQLRDCLKGYFPQILEVFEDLSSKVTSSFLLCWSTPESIQTTSKTKFLNFFKSVKSYGAIRNEERIARLKAALSITTNQAIISASALRVRSLCAQLSAIHSSINEFDKRIRELLADHPDAKLFGSFPVTGDIHRARLMVAFGTDRNRFSSAQDVQTYTGIAPVKDRSGKKEVIRARKACSHFLRQTFVEWAGATINAGGWAKAYYARARAKGKSHHVAVRALAFKWIRIMYACWKSGSSYSEELYLKQSPQIT
jgi:transposase